MTLKLYPCARYHAHMEELKATQMAHHLANPDPQKQPETPIKHDHSFCAFAGQLDPVALSVPDADAQFWSCPCAVARAMRDVKQHEKALWDIAEKRNGDEHIIRVRALCELADMDMSKEITKH